jgi:hypothetical protein
VSRAPGSAPDGLYWFQPGTTPVCRELRDASDRVIGTLRDHPKPAVTWDFTDPRRARGEVGSSHWELSIERKGFGGFFGLSGTALIDGGQTGRLDAAAFFSKGTLSLASGRQLRWKGSLIEGASCFFLDEGDRPLMELRSGSYFKRVNAYVDVPHEAEGLREWPLLAVFGMYLRLLMNRVFD